MKALDLQTLYVNELRESIGGPGVNLQQTATLIRRAQAEDAAAYSRADDQTWVWSDLHLAHEPSLHAFGRPFRTAAEADRAMMEAWYDVVSDKETIMCLGDITVDGDATAYHQAWWRKAPGTKWLVLGNHDVDPINQVRPFEVERRMVSLLAAGEPPLLLTHVPLLRVPHGAINVHGHIHGQESPTRDRHVNVSVEQLNYRPVKLSDIRRLARRLVEGRTVPGHSTRARLTVAERVMP